MSGIFPKVYLVRHGETACSLSRQATGRADIPLTDRGERDAQELSRHCQSKLGFSVASISPLPTAWEGSTGSPSDVSASIPIRLGD